MFGVLVAGLGGVPLETVLLALIALAIGVLVARVVLSIAWKVLAVAILLVGAAYAAGVLL